MWSTATWRRRCVSFSSGSNDVAHRVMWRVAGPSERQHTFALRDQSRESVALVMPAVRPGISTPRHPRGAHGRRFASARFAAASPGNRVGRRSARHLVSPRPVSTHGSIGLIDSPAGCLCSAGGALARPTRREASPASVRATARPLKLHAKPESGRSDASASTSAIAFSLFEVAPAI